MPMASMLPGKERPRGVEYVSANPTGPLHVGHGRAAAIGDCIARVLQANGWDARREFYYNDAGVQIENLALSVQARAKGLKPDDAGWPEAGYRGDYIQDVADAYMKGETVESDGHAITGARDADDRDAIRRFAVAALRREQNGDLAAFDVSFDTYFLESSLYADSKVEETVERLNRLRPYLRGRRRTVVEDHGLRRRQGPGDAQVRRQLHLLRAGRGLSPQQVAARLPARDHRAGRRPSWFAGARACRPAGAGCRHSQGWPEYVLHQMVTVMRGGEEVKLSKRAGSYFTLRDLIEEAGCDATRWFLIARKPDSQLTFDIDLAREQSKDNPVYYVQYAHARVFSILDKAVAQGYRYDQDNGLARLALLDDEHSLLLMVELSRYPEVVENAGQLLEPHLIAQYLRELAYAFHTWYHEVKALVEDADTRDARLALACAARQVLANGLQLLGVSAPEKM